jgi:8-oxo-dGTP pyrophosphatase MutT (NUDIX family)
MGHPNHPARLGTLDRFSQRACPGVDHRRLEEPDSTAINHFQKTIDFIKTAYSLNMKKWKTTSRTTLLSHSNFLTVENHVVELPNGRIIDDWPWIIAPDFVNVVAVTENGKILCFHQFKYAVDGLTLAPVGGYIQAGEDPLPAAKRELLEEAGYQSDSWVHLGTFSNMANRGGGVGHAYLALGAKGVAKPDSDDLEDQKLLLLDAETVKQALLEGEFKVFSWAATLALALMHLEQS